MKNNKKTKTELTEELAAVRGRLRELEASLAAAERAPGGAGESEEKYRNLFHGSKDAIFIHDQEGNIFDANEQASTLFGYTAEEIVSLQIEDLHPPEALAASRGAFTEISCAGSVTFEIDFKKKNGDVFPAEVSSSIFEIGGKKLYKGSSATLPNANGPKRCCGKNRISLTRLYRVLPPFS